MQIFVDKSKTNNSKNNLKCSPLEMGFNFHIPITGCLRDIYFRIKPVIVCQNTSQILIVLY